MAESKLELALNKLGDDTRVANERTEYTLLANKNRRWNSNIPHRERKRHPHQAIVFAAIVPVDPIMHNVGIHCIGKFTRMGLSNLLGPST